jgi:hypothetical protein
MVTREMARKQGTCLLALAVALCAASFVPAAQAEVTFTTPTSGSLENRGNGPGRFVTAGIGITCDEAVYRGEAGGRSRTLALEPEYGECTGEALAGFPADFFQELCDYLLHDLRKDGQGWKATVDLNCTAVWNAVGWDFYETENAYAIARNFCFTRIPEQPGIGTAELRNLPGGKGIEIHWDLKNFRYKVETPNRETGGSLLCGSMLGGPRRDAYYRGTTVVVARDIAGGPPLDLSISG